MRYISDSHNWWTSPFDGYDAWEDDCVDKEEFYNSLSDWRREQVDSLETEDEKDEFMHKLWLERQKDAWEEWNRDRLF